MAGKEVKLPDVGEGVTEGELVKWLVKVGDYVKADQPVAEIMTDKATVEVPTPYDGVVKELLKNEGDIIPIETVILMLEGGSSKEVSKSPVEAKQTKSAQLEMTSQLKPDLKSNYNTNGNGSTELIPPADFNVLATPATRRLAREMGVDINNIQGSGPIGRVTREDILKSKDVGSGAGATAASRPAMVMPPKMSFKGVGGALEERVSMRGIRKKIAENMQTAKHIVPHFTLMEEVNVTELVKVREQAKAAAEKQGVKVTYLPFIMKALIATIREFPMFNASIDDAASEIVYKKYFNLGFAADTPNGLLVPVIKDGDHKTVIELSREIIELSKKARDGKLALDEMKGATITITNIGSVGGVYATPIINHPEVAILGMYKISDKPVWKNNQWVPEKFMNFTITCDHRLIDGAVAANFMKSFASRVENPSQLILDMM